MGDVALHRLGGAAPLLPGRPGVNLGVGEPRLQYPPLRGHLIRDLAAALVLLSSEHAEIAFDRAGGAGGDGWKRQWCVSPSHVYTHARAQEVRVSDVPGVAQQVRDPNGACLGLV